MIPEYNITAVDARNWEVTRTAKSEKDGEDKLVTRSCGYYPKLDQAGRAVYELALKDGDPINIRNLRSVNYLIITSTNIAVNAINEAAQKATGA